MDLPKPTTLAVNSLIAPYNIEKLIDCYEEQAKAGIRKRWLTVAEAEDYTGLSKFTLARKATAGLITSVKLSASRSGKVLFDVESLDRWLNSLKKDESSDDGSACND